MDLISLQHEPSLPSSFPLPPDRPFVTDEARQEGLTSRDLTWLLDHGFIRRMVKGVYVANHLADSTALRCAALRLVVPEDCVVCDRHAGWLHGAEMILAPNEHLTPRPISVFRPSGLGRLRNGLADSGERNLTSEDIDEIDGLRVTTPLRTAWDLGRVRWPDPAIAALDSMLRLNAFTYDELLADIERFRGMRWVRTLRQIAPLADGRSQSPGESVLRLKWIECGLPTPEPQVEVRVDGRVIAYLDIGNKLLRFAAEYDGAEWHSSPSQREHDDRRRALASQEGWHIVPFVAADVFNRSAQADVMLRAGAAEARRRFGSSIA